MLASIYLEEHEYLTNEPQTINFGGQYLYNFIGFIYGLRCKIFLL